MIIDLSAWDWPQWTMVAILALNVLLAAAHHGRPRDPVSVTHAIIGCGITTTLLAFGGFF